MNESITLDVDGIQYLTVTPSEKNPDEYEVFFSDLTGKTFPIGLIEFTLGNLLYTCNDDTLNVGIPYTALRVLADYIENNLEE